MRANLKKIIEKKGCNFYRQHARPDPPKIDMACEVCAATYEWGRTEESRMLICEDCGEGYMYAAWAAKKSPRVSGAIMLVSDSKDYIIPGWTAAL